MLRSNLSNVRYAHWMDDRAAIAGRSYLNIFGVVTGTGLKVASFTNAPGDDNVSCKLNRLAAFQVAGITPDDVANVMDNPADAQEYRDLLTRHARCTRTTESTLLLSVGGRYQNCFDDSTEGGSWSKRL